MASLADLAGAAEKILAAFVTQLEAQKVAVPDRRYRSPGPNEVWDGEQLTVALVTVHQGQPGVQFGQAMQPSMLNLSAQFRISLVREILVLKEGAFVDGVIPSADEIDADGAKLLGDGDALIKAATQIHSQDWQTQGQAFGVTFPGEGFAIDGLTPVSSEGGLSGNRLLISLSVN